MPMPSDILTHLADALVEVYSDQATARTAAVTAGLDPAHIPFGPTTFDTWVAILQQAELQGYTQRLVQRALNQYASHTPLAQASRDYAAWVAAGRPASDPQTVRTQESAAPGQSGNPPARGSRMTVDTGGGAFIGGSITLGPGSTFVGRDQVTTSISNTQTVTLAQFVALVAEIRHSVATAGLDADTAAVFDADLRLVESQASQPAPNQGLILSRLDGAAHLLAAASTPTAAGLLLPKVEQAQSWAAQLFGVR